MARKRKQKGARGVCSKPPAPVVNIAQGRSKRSSIQRNRKESILIAVPSVSGRADLSIAMTFARAMGSNHVDSCPFKFDCYVEPGTRPIEYARNRIVKHFMENTDYDWLYMIDDDERVPDNFWQLCTIANIDVVAAVVPVWVANGPAEAYLRVNTYGIDDKGRCFNLEQEQAGSPYRAPAVGTGAIAIRRRVFAPRPYGLGTEPFRFTREESGKILAGEDINFSVDCQRAGFSVAVHPGVVFDHIKNLSLAQVNHYASSRHDMISGGKSLTPEQRLSLG